MREDAAMVCLPENIEVFGQSAALPRRNPFDRRSGRTAPAAEFLSQNGKQIVKQLVLINVA